MICKFWKISAASYLFYALALAAAQVPGPKQSLAASDRPDLKTIVQRVERAAQANRERYRAYIITRDYRMYSGTERKPASEVTADVSFVPPSTKDFTIIETKGSSRGETVVRHILEGEQKAASTGQAPGAVSNENYDFTLLGEETLGGRSCYVLGLQPKLKEKNLVIGRAWVEKDTYLVRRIQGQLAKMPSWWIKSAEVTLDFGSVGGMWLQTRTVARADVRVVGPHTLTEDAVKIRTGAVVADAIQQRGRRRPFQHTEAVIGAFEH